MLVNDRNLAIVVIMVMVIFFILVGKTPSEAADIVEKAIIAVGSLATGSIARDSSKVSDTISSLAKKVFKGKKPTDTGDPKPNRDPETTYS
jgi:flagellar motor component MotA